MDNMNKRAVVTEALRELMDVDGRLTPEQVVEAAKAPKHPLHGFFEWDIKNAARLHWLETASRLIRMVEYRETYNEKVIVAPFYVRDPDRPADQQGYRAITHIRTDAQAAHEVLIDEMVLVRGILNRALSVAQALEMESDVVELSTMVESFLAALQQQRGDDTSSPDH